MPEIASVLRNFFLRSGLQQQSTEAYVSSVRGFVKRASPETSPSYGYTCPPRGFSIRLLPMTSFFRFHDFHPPNVSFQEN